LLAKLYATTLLTLTKSAAERSDLVWPSQMMWYNCTVTFIIFSYFSISKFYGRNITKQVLDY